MRFYRATAFLFPQSYERRILLVCFGSTQIPVIASIILQALTGEWHPAVLVTLIVAALIGAALGMAAIHALLSPVSRAAAMLEAIHDGQHVDAMPQSGQDLVARLFRSVATVASESAARLERLADIAERDALTGIRNRRGFLDSAEGILSGTSNSVIALIDIDHFKLINDQFGHEAGDSLLKALAKRLEDALRHTDVTARWGGEEFVVLFPNTQLDEARTVMERLRASVALDSELGHESWPVTFSCGLAPVRTFAELGDATHRANAALGIAKGSGRNRVQVAMEN